jgi:cytochrome c biogenesis protein CcmG/thiol:disulfide interchange protein DsbE
VADAESREVFVRIQGSRTDLTFLLVVLAISLGFNAYLGRLYLVAPTVPAGLRAGAPAPPLDAIDPAGRAGTIRFGEEPTVLYVFSPTCAWCRKNLPNIQHLSRRPGFRFVGVALEERGLAEHLQQSPLGFPVYVRPSEASRAQYSLGPVPQTVVVSADGRVLHNWIGAYTEERLKEIERFFETQLPGLADTAADPTAG